jgi:hypothetical protein
LAAARAPLQESAWRLMLRAVPPRVPGEAFPAARCEPPLSMVGTPETLAAKPVAAQEASALASGGTAGAAAQLVRLPAAEGRARRVFCL